MHWLIDASSNTLSLLKFHVAPANCESFLQPLQYAEFGVGPFGFPTIHPPCVSLLRAWLCLAQQ